MKIKNFIVQKWYWILTVLLLAFQFIVFLFFNKDSYIGIHDNLDIHIVDYQIMKLNNAFFTHGETLPMLGGISRDFLASELSLYTLLYVLFPNFTAYIAGYFMKILIALFSSLLLAKDILKDNYKKYEPIVVLSGLVYGLLPLYPGFSFSFASIPLLIYLIHRIEQKPAVKNYIFLFAYPLVSYFTFFGIFLIGYLLVYTIYRSIRERKISIRLLTACFILFLGYACCEYRLFSLMLFDNTPTIRDTMFNGNDGIVKIIANIADVLVNGVFHAYDFHKYLVLPVCIVYFLFLNIRYIRTGNGKKITHDPFNLLFAFILCNCIIYGLYTLESFRTLVETILSPLKGWQFTRTVFFNPFLWYLEFFIILKRIYDKKFIKAANILALISLLIVIGTQSLYNDFYNTVYTHTWMAVKNKKSESLSYREFYSEKLFQEIKNDIGYAGEYAAAYGMHPAILQYNGISTLDACLSYYYQSYKEEFREIITPALEQSEDARVYFDDWGARAYLFSGTDDTVWAPVRTMNVSDFNLSINADAFRDLNGKYIFSRIKIENETELNLILLNSYSDEESPYTIYVYETL